MFSTDQYQPSPSSLGSKGVVVTYTAGSAVLGKNVKTVMVATFGSVVFKPKGQSNPLTLVDMNPGFILPWLVGEIVEAGTTATLITIED